MLTAQMELSVLRNELAFEQITVELSDEGRHWKFKYGDRHIADYWPASGRGQLVGAPDAVNCVSVAQAQKLAVGAKKRLFSEIAKALQQSAAGADITHLSPEQGNPRRKL